MAKVFISYAREDRPVVEKLAKAIDLAGHHVWFDRALGAGPFRDQIIAQLNAADVAIVVWSARSRDSRYVIDEAERGVARGILLPVRIDQAELPLGFGALHTFDLSAWQGRADDTKFGAVLEQIEKLARSPTAPGQRAGIAVVGKSALLAALVATICAALLVLLNALKHGQPISTIGLSDVVEGFAVAVVCAIPVMVWSALEVRRFGLSHPALILRRASRIYTWSALGALVVAAMATIKGVTQGLSPPAAVGQLGFVVVLATLVIGAGIAIASAIVQWIKGLMSAG